MNSPEDIIDPSGLAPQTRVDQYLVLRRIGRGGMGEVYLAKDTQLGRNVALKVIRAEGLEDRDSRQRFLREARLTAQFNHPHIVTLYGAGLHGEMPYVALEHLEGQTLKERLQEERLGTKEALRIGLHIAEALREAHSHRVLHRDLKPQNVLLPRDGRLRVLDFGLSRKVREPQSETGSGPDSEPVTAPAPAPRDTAGASQDSSRDDTVPVGPQGAPDLTMPHAGRASESLPKPHAGGAPASSFSVDLDTRGKGLRGTPSYMAPEQWREQASGPAADVWALGVILFELFAGEHPYAGAGFHQLALAVGMPEPAASLGLHAPDLSPEIISLVDRCLAKDPEQRPTAEKIAVQLAGMLTGSARRRHRRTPFRGLMPFSERHADLFFGREDDVAGFLERLREEPVVPVVGPSGVGKSSFVQAGVIPRLREQGHWHVLRLRPGRRPFETLASRLVTGESQTADTLDSAAVQSSRQGEDTEDLERSIRELATHLQQAPERLSLKLRQLAQTHRCRVLLFVDQLEEIYTLVPDRAMRRAFMEALSSAADDAAGPVRAVFALRDDFLWRVAEGDAARELLGRVLVLRPPDEDDLIETLTGPLEQVGSRFADPGLPAEMVAEVVGESAALPLLQFAAQQLWERREPESQAITREAYEAIGGVAGALAQHTEGLLAALSPSQIRVAREIFLRLVTPDSTRRVLEREPLLQGLGDGAPTVLDHFTAARVIVVRRGRDTAALELVHESLIHNWERLSLWLDESRDERAFLDEIGQAAALWEKRGRPASEVWQGAALDDAMRQAAQCGAVPELVVRFLEAGQRAVQRSLRRRRGLQIAGVSILVAVAVASTVVGWVLRRKERVAQSQRRIAQERQAEAVTERATALREGARTALGRGSLVEARAKLRISLEAGDAPLTRALWWRLSRHRLWWRKDVGAPLHDVAVSADGRYIAAVSAVQTVHLFDMDTASERVLRGHRDQVFSVALSADGRYVATGTWSGELRLWTRESGESRVLRKRGKSIWSVAFSPDSLQLAVGCDDRTVTLYDVARAKVAATLKSSQGAVRGLCYRPDGKRLAAAGSSGAVEIWDVALRRPHRVQRIARSSVRTVSYSPDGRRIAAAGANGVVTVFDAEGGTIRHRLRGHRARLVRVAFSPDGQWIASGGFDKSVRLWNATTGAAEAVLHDHESVVYGVAFSPDSRRLVTVGFDRELKVWNLNHARRKAVLRGHARSSYGLAFRPDSKQLASASGDKDVLLWSVATAHPVGRLRGHTSGVYAVAYSPSGRWIATGSQDHTVRLWDARSTAPKAVLRGHTDGVFDVAFTPDGKMLASTGIDFSVRLWDVATGAPRGVLHGNRAVAYDLDIHPDGKLLVTACGDKVIRMWDLQTKALVAELSGHKNVVWSARFEPRGRYLISASIDGTLLRWDAPTGSGSWKPHPLRRLPGRTSWLDVHPDSKRVGLPGADGMARIRRMGHPGEVVLRGHVAEVNHLRFSPDGRWAATSSDDGTVRLWDATTGQPAWRAAGLRGAGELARLGRWVRLARDTTRVSKLPSRARWRKAVARTARFTAESVQGRLLCLAQGDRAVELWDVARDRRLLRRPLVGITRLLARPDGCVTLAGGKLTLHRRTGPPQSLATGVTGVGQRGRTLLWANGRQVSILGPDLRLVERFSVAPGVVALALVRDQVVLGFRDGGVEIIRRGSAAPGQKGARSGRRSDFTLQSTPASPVTLLQPGPRGTLLVGYANGQYGLWSWSGGNPLLRRRLHGPITAAVRSGSQLHVASSLGQHDSLDLAGFERPYCDLLREVWRLVPVGWSLGRPVRRAAPKRHRCLVAPTLRGAP